jgi:hypothetical protein
MLVSGLDGHVQTCRFWRFFGYGSTTRYLGNSFKLQPEPQIIVVTMPFDVESEQMFLPMEVEGRVLTS